ncbi:Secretion activator protein [Bosea sp. LC85]|uniref:glycoside hydrolase family 108 protein n=1 Tax=Bosea sp. LC85 TaxID=1502851 RepID=UPI0004E39E63|nr:glycosyl hydrolase 108 family protein [Bosea sp. LC85]KFC63965.1 Secretion activator protein [Bosea sp. LC85]
MSDRFTICLPITLAHEGGYVDHPKDPGGATNLGVTIGTLSSWLGRRASKAEVRALTVKAVEPIYRKNYWQAANCPAYQPGADLCVFDAAVNSGPGRAVQWAKGVKAASGKVFVAAYCDARLGFLKRLGTWSSFGKGWSRRVAEIRAKGTTMALAAAGITGTPARAALEIEAAKSDGKARRDQAAAGTAGAGGAGGVAVAPMEGVSSGSAWGAIAIIGVIVIGAATFLFIRSRNRRDEAAAFRLEAAHV